VSFLLRESEPGGLLDALEAGELDLVIIARVLGATRRARKRAELPVAEGDPLGPTRAHLARERWIDDELVLVSAPGVDAASAPLVTFARGASTRAIVDEHFPGTPIAMELGSIATVKANARAGVGVALVSRRAVERDLASGQLVIVPDRRTPILRPLFLVHRGRDRLPPACAELHRMLREHAPPAARARG
jgi:DNA-binding transcriptional LysR family regulator